MNRSSRRLVGRVAAVLVLGSVLAGGTATFGAPPPDCNGTSPAYDMVCSTQNPTVWEECTYSMNCGQVETCIFSNYHCEQADPTWNCEDGTAIGTIVKEYHCYIGRCLPTTTYVFIMGKVASRCL